MSASRHAQSCKSLQRIRLPVQLALMLQGIFIEVEMTDDDLRAGTCQPLASSATKRPGNETLRHNVRIRKSDDTAKSCGKGRACRRVAGGCPEPAAYPTSPVGSSGPAGRHRDVKTDRIVTEDVHLIQHRRWILGREDDRVDLTGRTIHAQHLPGARTDCGYRRGRPGIGLQASHCKMRTDRCAGNNIKACRQPSFSGLIYREDV